MSRNHFKGKRVAVIGLGPHAELVTDIKYLIKAGALVALYDLRSEARLKSHIVFLRSIGLANYVCGSIPPEDLLDMDVIMLSHEYPRESSFLVPAREKNIPIEYPETLFFKLAPPVTVVGVMGESGKATVVSMLEPMLEIACSRGQGENLFTIDPESDRGTIAHLAKIKNGDMLLIRILETMMPELHALRMSPHVAVFTTIPPVGSYVTSPFEILAYQTYNNFIVGSDEVIDATRVQAAESKAKKLRTKASFLPADWTFAGRGSHDRMNASLALQTAQIFKVDNDTARDIFEKWKPLKGRLELVRKIKNVEFYNDTASVTSCSTLTGLQAVGAEKKVVLVFGGMESGCDYRSLYTVLPTAVHTMILLPGSGTLKERRQLQELNDIKVYSAHSIEQATRLALEHADKSDRVLFSPGFRAGGFDSSRKERGERFVRAVKAL